MWNLSRTLGFDRVAPTGAEVLASMPGDDLVPQPRRGDGSRVRGQCPAGRAFGLGSSSWARNARAGTSPSVRSASSLAAGGPFGVLDPRWLDLAPGDVIPDYGGRRATFTVDEMIQDSVLVYTSRRGRTDVSWSIRLRPVEEGATRVQLRLRLGPVRHKRLADTVGGYLRLAHHCRHGRRTGRTSWGAVNATDTQFGKRRTEGRRIG